MNSLHTQVIKSRGLLGKANKVCSFNYESFISKDDPTRLNSVKLDDLVLNTLSLYKLCDVVHVSIQEYKIRGTILYLNKEYLVLYVACPVRVIVDNTYISCVPMVASYTTDCKKDTEVLPLLVPVEEACYIACSEGCNSVILCPGSIRFIAPPMEGKTSAFSKGIYILGVYSMMSEEKFLSVCQDEDIYMKAISPRIDMTQVDNIISYLTDYHTYNIQRGYYSPNGSVAARTFDTYGKKFYVGNISDPSYYDRLYMSDKELNKNKITRLPLYDNSSGFVRLYAQRCNLSLQVRYLKLSPYLDNVYDTPLDVDVRTLDLNFVWTEAKRGISESFPEDSYYSLSDDDTMYLQYAMNGPGILVAIYGNYIMGITRGVISSNEEYVDVNINVFSYANEC